MLSGFLASRGLQAGDLTPQVLGEFLATRRRTATKIRSPQALAPLLGYMRRLGVVCCESEVAAPEPPTLAAFGEYLRTERGLAPTTVAGYISQVRPFLAAYPEQEQWRSLTPKQVSVYALRRADRVSAGSLRAEASALRVLLRWMWLEGMLSAPLADAIGPFASVRGIRPPKALTAEEVDRLTSAVAAGPDRLRNEAMVALMLRLGLRAGEVAALRLEDIAWHEGIVRVRGKGAHLDALPLPVDVGQALAAYLEQRRPSDVVHRQVFFRSPAPHRPLSGTGVSLMVSNALRRAEVTGGGAAHRLRHTAGAP